MRLLEPHFTLNPVITPTDQQGCWTNEMTKYIKLHCKLFSIKSILVKNKVLMLAHDIFIIIGKTSPIFHYLVPLMMTKQEY